MTVVAAFNDSNHIWIASDSNGTEGDFTVDCGSKLIFVDFNYIIGFSDSYRVADLIKECENLPKEINDISDVAKLRDIVRGLMLSDGAAPIAVDNSTLTHPVDLIIAAPSGIYTIECDYQIHVSLDNYYAIGTGKEIAMGVLCACTNMDLDTGEWAVDMAVSAATKHIASCAGECHIGSVELFK